MRCTLPFCMETECKSYHNNAFKLGIIKANLKDYNRWLSNKLINSICTYVYEDDYPYFEILEEDLWELDYGFAECQTISITPELFQNGVIQLVDLVRYMLQSGYYVIGFYNEYYIPGKKAYGEYNFWHDYILYGYDDEKQVFQSAGYLKDGKYKAYEISYKNYFEGVCHLGKECADFWFYRMKEDYRVEVKPDQILRGLKDYLNSTYKPKEDGMKKAYYFGIAAWEMYADYMLQEKYRYMDLRFSRAFMEHKVIMLNRLQVLYEEGYLKDEEIVLRYKSEIAEKAGTIHLLCLKFNQVEDPKIRVRLHDRIHLINRKEVRILEEVIKMLEL